MSASASSPPHATVAIEDYAAAIHALQRDGGGVRTGQIAGRLGVTPGSVSGMIARLDRLGLAERDPYHGVRLTASGKRLVDELLRRHRLIETWLVDALGLPPERAQREAARLAHYVSPTVEAAIARRCRWTRHAP